MIVLCASLQENPPDRLTEPCGKAGVRIDLYHQQPNVGVIAAYQALWKRHADDAVQCYVHDDVSLHDDWADRVACELMDPGVAIVGLGGATGIGHRDLYRVRYRIEDLARIGYVSNQTDWKTHGERETGERDVAVVDGFFMAVKGSFLRKLGGWDWIQSNFHCYDLALCLEAHRRGYRVRMAGVACTHHGGGTSTSQSYVDFLRDRGLTPEEDHQLPHRWLYAEYRDVLPLRIDR